MSTYQPGSDDAPVPMNLAQMAAENERVLIERGPIARSYFPPPWLRKAGANAALIGACMVAVGAPCAVVGIWVPSWLPVSLWCAGSGGALLVVGLGAVAAGWRRRS